MSPEQWLQEHAFWCPHLHARIRPRQCDELRGRKPSKSWGFQGAGAGETKSKPSSCEVCTDWRWLQRMKGKSKEDVERVMTQHLIDCLECGRQDVKNTGRGLCGTCYAKTPPSRKKKYSLAKARQKRQDRLALEKMAAKQETGPVKPSVTCSMCHQAKKASDINPVTGACAECEAEVDERTSLLDGGGKPESHARSENTDKYGVVDDQSSHLMDINVTKSTACNESQPTTEDPLAGLEPLNLNQYRAPTPPVMPSRAAVSGNRRHLNFSSTATKKFKLKEWKKFTVYPNNGHLLLHLRQDGDLTFSAVKGAGSVSASAKAMSKALGWQGGEWFRVEGTSREDVVKLVREEG